MKKIVLTLAVTLLCAGSVFASGKHHNKTRKGEVAAGIAAGVTAALFGRPTPPPPPPPPTTASRPEATSSRSWEARCRWRKRSACTCIWLSRRKAMPLTRQGCFNRLLCADTWQMKNILRMY